MVVDIIFNQVLFIGCLTHYLSSVTQFTNNIHVFLYGFTLFSIKIYQAQTYQHTFVTQNKSIYDKSSKNDLMCDDCLILFEHQHKVPDYFFIQDNLESYK